MIIKKFKDKRLADYCIVNQSEYTRSGFTHESVLMYKNCEMNRAKLHYINRTWERYLYESSMYQVVWEQLESMYKKEVQIYKEKNGIARMTEKHRIKVTKYLEDNSKRYQELKLMLKEINE